MNPGLRSYTSHWGSLLLPHVAAVIVAISRGKPRWKLPFRYRRFDELAPSNATWQLEDTGEFERSYVGQLEELGAEAILARLRQIGDGRPVVLLCWEKPGETCHRRWLADFLQREAGMHVPELAAGMLLEREGVPEPRLF
jgi:hypothetical protein